MRLFKITTQEGVMYVTVHAETEQEVRCLLEEFVSQLGVNPLGIYFTEIITYHLTKEKRNDN